MIRHSICLSLFLVPTFAATADDTVYPATGAAAVGVAAYGDDLGEVGTARGDILEGRGEYVESLGRGALLKSMSATQFQEAIEERLENRKQRVEQYYELQNLHDREVKQDSDRPTAEEGARIAKAKAPDRLNENQIDRQSGELYWPSPLDAAALKSYRKPIEETLAKRASGGEVYRQFDYLKVGRMVDLMTEAVDSIKDKLDVKEVVALKGYLKQIDYEARFNAKDERVDY